MSNLSVIILAAGKGTRMKSGIAKHLHKIGNLEMIMHIINTAKELDAQEIVCVSSEENVEQIKKNIDKKIKTIIQYERLGTAHATNIGFEALEHKSNNILIMYGDVPLVKKETYKKMIDLLENSGADIIDLGFETKDISNKYGRLMVDNNGNVEEIIEYKDADEETRNVKLCNSGILVVKSNNLSQLISKVNNINASSEYYLTDIIKIAQDENKICKYIVTNEDEVIGVDSRQNLSIAEQIFQDGKRKEFMAQGVSLIDPKSTFFSYDTEIENDVIIEPNVVILPHVKINKNVTIHSFSYLENCVIEENASIGPFARIRPQTTIKAGVHIGNFVEIKNSTIGEETKIGHLTYIGDTTIGKNTNIGAGCITCNYDGFAKFKTNIGNNCFIGSNTVMVAPVLLDNDCMTGAGSVITKNIGQNDIALGRADQINLKNKAIRYREKRNKK